MDATTQFAHRVLGGTQRGVSATLLRGALSALEPLYAGVMLLRNRLYQSGVLRACRLPRPVISIGNITAGGTGKTPMVLWLAQRLEELGHHPAILMRGYRRGGATISDEQALLASHGLIVQADPDRARGGRTVLSGQPETDVLLLDDGFQHRGLHRDVDLVLIDATNPFGFGHVHPRGLLREPLSGLRRATAFIITRSDMVNPQELARIEGLLRARNPAAPIFHAAHAHTGLLDASSQALPLSALAGRRFFAAAAIANPQALAQQLAKLPGTLAGALWLADHHDYTAADVHDVIRQASEAGADCILVTEKDWVKLARWPDAIAGAKFLRLQLSIEFPADHGPHLLALVQAALAGQHLRNPI